MDRSLFDVVMEAALAIAEAGRSACPSGRYPRAAGRAPDVRRDEKGSAGGDAINRVSTVAAATAVREPKSYALPANRVRVVAVRKGGSGK